MSAPPFARPLARAAAALPRLRRPAAESPRRDPAVASRRDIESWRRAGAGGLPALVWVALVVAGHLLAARLVATDPLVHIGAPPLVGGFDIRLSWSLGAAIALAAAVLVVGPALAARLRWGSLLLVTWLAGGAWIVALAVGNGGGPEVLWAPLTTRYEYLPAVALAGNAREFLRGFVDALPSYPTHVAGHPPGMVLALSLLDSIGLGGARWAAVLVVGAGAVTAPAALVAMRVVAGERLARRAALFVTIGPAAVWLGTSADALFSATLAIGVALLAVACGPAAPRRGARGALAVLAGLVLGCGLMLSYGLAPLGLVPLAVAVATRRWRLLALATGGGVAVLLAFAAAGFWWPAGLEATRAVYGSGISARRPYLDFLVISPAAFALALGPAAFAGLAALRGRARVLPGAALAALLVAALSGLSKGETERIWLPFAPWLLLATAALRAPRAWLAVQLALAIGLQVAVRSPW